jgi:hypothetical protein
MHYLGPGGPPSSTTPNKLFIHAGLRTDVFVLLSKIPISITDFMKVWSFLNESKQLEEGKTEKKKNENEKCTRWLL